GYSGGALFNANWQLVGMIRADEPPFAHALAIDQVLSQLKAWRYPVNLIFASDDPISRYQVADFDERKLIVAELVSSGPDAYKTLKQLAESEEDLDARQRIFGLAWRSATNALHAVMTGEKPSEDQLGHARSAVGLRQAIFPESDGGAAELVTRLDALGK